MPNVLKKGEIKTYIYIEAAGCNQEVYVNDSLFSLLKVVTILKMVTMHSNVRSCHLYRTDEDVEMEMYSGKFQKHYR